MTNQGEAEEQKQREEKERVATVQSTSPVCDFHITKKFHDILRWTILCVVSYTLFAMLDRRFDDTISKLRVVVMHSSYTYI